MAEYSDNLGEVVTAWTKVFNAAETAGEIAERARGELLLRYHEAVQRYLRRQLNDDHAADQLYSNFALRVLEVDPFLKRADPTRGRFRDYLKAILRRMVIDHFRGTQRERRHRQELTPGADAEPVQPALADEEDEQFTACWRQEVINHAWKALDAVEKQTGRPYATVLRLQEQQPGVRSAQLAEQLSAKLGQPFTAAGVRQLVHRGREAFGDLLVKEVARSLQAAPGQPVERGRIEAELIDLKLFFSYCKDAVERLG
jgi:RNA polymerase sigma-70 factor (ECF subfamily)